jgi:hypothetical protein
LLEQRIVCDQIGRRTIENHLATSQGHHPIGVFGNQAQVVGGNHDGQSLGPQSCDLAHQRLGGLAVLAEGGLIQQQRSGAEHE